MHYRSEGNSPPMANDKMYRPKKVFFSGQRMVFRVIIGPFLRKDLSKQRNYLGIIKIFDFLGKIIGQ